MTQQSPATCAFIWRQAMKKQWIWTALLMVSCGHVQVPKDGVDLESARLVPLECS